MASFPLSAIHVISHGSGIAQVQLVGPGWTENARRVAALLVSGEHEFVATLADGQYRLKLLAESGTTRLVAVRPDGAVLGLAQLADRLAARAAAETATASKTGKPWWQRLPFFGKTLSLA